MARTLTLDAVFKAGIAVGITVSTTQQAQTNSQVESNTTASNTVNVKQTSTHENHPLASLSGLFAGDPLWAEYLQAIREIEEEDEMA